MAIHERSVVMSHASQAGANALITELKTRARLRLNAQRREQPGDTAPPTSPDEAPRLRDALNSVSRDLGFLHWEHARRVLGGEAVPGDDLGGFWHTPRCTGFLNHWYARHEQALEGLAASEHRVLVPYRRQFIVVDGHYLRELGLDIAHEAWHLAGRDLVQAYGSAAWLSLCDQRLRATRGVATT